MIPRLLFKKHWVAYIALLILVFVVFLGIRQGLFPSKPPMMRGRPMGPIAPMSSTSRVEFEIFRLAPGNSVFLFIVILMISAGFRIVQEWMRAEKKARQVETERMAMELSLLRSQINPHFLFNTLNSIYSLALMKSEATADAVMKLSDIMRYMTEDSVSDLVALNKEVDYICHYVELQKIRLGSNNHVSLEVEGNFTRYLIPPLILMPFVENAFKYGTSSHEQAAIHIFLKAEQGRFQMKVSNMVFSERRQMNKKGLGIENTRKRLEHAYPGHHTLEIIKNQRFFQIDLIISLT
jgi:sensor histidine kinase YesM